MAPLDLIVQYLKKTYGEAPIALIGCRSSDESYPPCEYDFLVILEIDPSLQRVIVDQTYVDALILSSKTIRATTYGRIALMQCVPISDPTMVLPSLRDSVGRIRLGDAFREMFEQELLKSLAEISRGEEALSEDDRASADFWLELATCHFGLARVAGSSQVPRPSHAAAQFRKLAEIVAPSDYALWAQALSANLATTTSIWRRLEAFSRAHRLYWLLADKQKTVGTAEQPRLSGDPEIPVQLAEVRCRYLINSHALLDAYAYVSLEMLHALERLHAAESQSRKVPPRHSAIMHELARSDQTESLVPLLGLNTDAMAAAIGLAKLKTRVKDLLRESTR